MAKRELDDMGRIAKLLRSKVRRELIGQLLDGDGDISIAPVDLARAGRIPLEEVAYNFRSAQKLGALELVKTETVWGTQKHFYGPTKMITSRRDLIRSMIEKREKEESEEEANGP
jgi:hypothetical protein